MYQPTEILKKSKLNDFNSCIRKKNISQNVLSDIVNRQTVSAQYRLSHTMIYIIDLNLTHL